MRVFKPRSVSPLSTAFASASLSSCMLSSSGTWSDAFVSWSNNYTWALFGQHHSYHILCTHARTLVASAVLPTSHARFAMSA